MDKLAIIEDCIGLALRCSAPEARFEEPIRARADRPGWWYWWTSTIVRSPTLEVEAEESTSHGRSTSNERNIAGFEVAEQR